MLDKPLSPLEAKQYSPLALAFFGDAVYELIVRQRLILSSNMQAGKLHSLAVSKVRASYQAMASQELEEHLTQEEECIFRRGRNANTTTVPKGVTTAQYHMATGLEALFGYLYLIGDVGRINELITLIWDLED